MKPEQLLDVIAGPLAVDGGTPVRTGPMPPWPHFAADEVAAAQRVLTSGRVNYWTGDEGRTFEAEFAEFVGCRHAVALANGTVALEIALRALGIGPGDEVVVPPRTFVATASAVVTCGARPVFADVDRVSQNLTADSVAAVLSERTRALIAVHLAGWPCAMDPLLELARRHDLKVIEDCAQAHGAADRGRRAGSLGDVGAFSFCQDKILTTAGEGGMLVTNDTALWQSAWQYKDHGKSYDAVYQRQHPPGFRWLHEGFGSNARMTEVQAAVGRCQLRKLPEWLAQRRAHAARLRSWVEDLTAVRLTVPPPAVEHAFYKFYLFVRPEQLQPGWDRDCILRAVLAEGVPCFSGSCSEVYRERCFQAAGLAPAEPCATAEELGATSLMLPVHPTLGAADVDDMGRALRRVLLAASAGGEGAGEQT